MTLRQALELTRSPPKPRSPVNGPFALSAAKGLTLKDGHTLIRSP